MILGVFTQLLGSGGIPYAGRQAAVVLNDFANELGLPCVILGLNDPLGTNEIRFHGEAFSLSGFARSKLRLALEVLSLSGRVKLAYFNHASIAPLALPLKLRNARYVVAGHGIEVWSRVPKLAGLALRSANAVTAPSAFTARQMEEVNGVDADRVSVVAWGLDPEFVECATRKPKASNGVATIQKPRRTMILTTARLDRSEKYKGIEDVIRALASIKSRFPDLTYVVVGEGNDRARLEQVAAQVGLCGEVFFAGAVTDDELASWHSAADIFAMPSKNEGLGLAFLEAMAYGKPVLAAREAATPEVVIDEETGLLVPYGDVSGVADALVRLVGDSQLRTKMGHAGRLRFDNNYTFPAFRDRLLKVLSSHVGSLS